MPKCATASLLNVLAMTNYPSAAFYRLARRSAAFASVRLARRSCSTGRVARGTVAFRGENATWLGERPLLSSQLHNEQPTFVLILHPPRWSLSSKRLPQPSPYANGDASSSGDTTRFRRNQISINATFPEISARRFALYGVQDWGRIRAMRPSRAMDRGFENV